MLELTLQAQPSPEAFARWAEVFRRYLAAHPSRTAEMLRKKGRDLGVRLYKGFEEHKWGGSGKHPGLAVSEQQQRQSGGEGTHVRDKLMETYRQSREALNFDVRSAGQQLRRARTSGTLDDWSAAADLRTQKRGLRAALWQKIVKAELGIRQASLGYQAAALLMFKRSSRWSVSKGERVYSDIRETVTSHTGGVLGSVTISDGEMTIESFAGHSAETAERFGIVDAAFGASAADMLEYLRDNELAALAEGLGGAA